MTRYYFRCMVSTVIGVAENSAEMALKRLIDNKVKDINEILIDQIHNGEIEIALDLVEDD